MSFLFGRARSRTTADLPRQAREHISKLDGPNAATKVLQSHSGKKLEFLY